MKMEIRAEFEISEEMIEDLLHTAFCEIGYWCSAEYIGEPLGDYMAEHVARGGELLIMDNESDDEWVLTRDKVLSGISKYVLEFGFENLMCNSEFDPSYADAEAADCIIQYGLFDEIVYG